MSFDRLDGFRLRNLNYLLGGFFVLFFAIMLYVHREEVPIFGESEDFMTIFCIMLLFVAIFLIYYAFIGTMKNYFLTHRGKCALVRGCSCSNGDCRNCVFADTWLKNKMKDRDVFE